MRIKRQQNRERIEDFERKQKAKGKPTNKSQALVRKKFEKEYLEVLEGLDIQVEGSMNYIAFGNALTDLKFVEPKEENEDVIFSAWREVSGESEELNEREFWKLCQSAYQAPSRGGSKQLYRKLGLTRTS